ADARIVTVIPKDAAPGPDDPPPPPPVPAVNDHRVRLGGFMPISDARALQQASADAGYPARVLHRVLLGPFAARAEARSARSGTRGILIGGSDEWWVQLGVFADADNAEGLREKMSAEGRAAVVQGRVDLGPFAGRVAAEQVLVAVRSALGRPLEQARVVAP
ncbi:MAG: SPOR domain-containing protein, partial [Azoarcus sp.]|nr:SPOR domain-containing protein [Azoarcus sp.]